MNAVSTIVEGIATIVGVALFVIVAVGAAIFIVPVLLVVGGAYLLGELLSQLFDEYRAR
jgi:hypothetical protein